MRSRADYPVSTLARASGSTRYGTWVASAMTVEDRVISGWARTRSMTRCRSALEQWPGFGEALCALYDASKAEAYRTLQNERMTSLPMMRAYLDETREMFGPVLDEERFGDAMAILATLRAPVDAFFDHVTVNCDVPELRANRLRLLSKIRATMSEIADFSRIEG